MRSRIIVHSRAEAEAACRAAAALGVEVILVSAAGAGAYAGPGWFEALMRAAAAEFPGAIAASVVDCADEPGTALAALRAGCRRIVFTGREDVRARLSEIAAAIGAVIETRGAPALDLREVRDPDAACRAFLESVARKG